MDDAALANLVGQGALTEADADAFKLAYAERVDIWDQMDTGKVTQGMMTKLHSAREAYRKALSNAGIMEPREPHKKHGHDRE